MKYEIPLLSVITYQNSVSYHNDFVNCKYDNNIPYGHGNVIYNAIIISRNWTYKYTPKINLYNNRNVSQ